MAPRSKRARLSAAPASSPPPSNNSRRGQSTSSIPSPAPSRSSAAPDLLNDPWTDAEETALFRQLIRYKPTGLHKHMAMLSIYTSLLSQGYVRDAPLPTPTADPDQQSDDKFVPQKEERHMSIRGLWRKLNELYDLDALDEREEEGEFARAFDIQPSSSSSSEAEAATPEPKRRGRRRAQKKESPRSASPSPAPIGKEFSLPSSDEDSDLSSDSNGPRTSFAALKWAKRFASPSPSVTGSGPPSPSAGTKRGRRGKKDKEKERERRDSSPAALPELLPVRRERPVRFTPSFEVPGPEGEEAGTPGKTAARGRGRGRPAGRGKGGASAAAAGGRRSSRVVAEDSEEGSGEGIGDEEESEEGDEDEDEESSESDEEEEEEESPQKKKPGRPARAGRGRGGRRGRGKK
ncbi:hypothetical protein K461DRAFT_277135 [Myriangium duriaei CBS 260.36]|uniref:Chromatin modification-related protein EAF7 n=1 Tax=Myriangium duriaei CBS 260.36 TaxID=1168546 RepID=A0A9P4MGV9_9PEZI|nr:hypothetical protein K461DRAFT_277135 [Myriangium duriaei CBS 260.36]